ncbi:hypothetical protein K227x_07750 [Rubripirellula lacrimiformis]|uniref:Uncharacterized protein n=1 Tax=Rubripirellula lacrimiformis TaxID=1930273 RepID=A0A517N5I6_9BACT|nr:hypothetical protein K227x_07750 [Rubripirellula lacrimiformis]
MEDIRYVCFQNLIPNPHRLLNSPTIQAVRNSRTLDAKPLTSLATHATVRLWHESVYAEITRILDGGN